MKLDTIEQLMLNFTKELKPHIDQYIESHHDYRESPAYISGTDRIFVTKGPCDLMFRVRLFGEGGWPPKTLVIARIGFSEERVGHGTRFLNFIEKHQMTWGFILLALNKPTKSAKG